MKLFVWICISLTLLGKVKAEFLNVTACYNNDTYAWYSLNCSATQTIRVTAAEYRCSGKESCGPDKTPEPTNFTCNTTGSSTRCRYIHVKYGCILGTEFIMDICRSPTNSNFSAVNIMLFKSNLTEGVSRCTCYVESQGTVGYELVDIRFFKADNNNGTHGCTNGNLTINGQSFKCSDDNKTFIYYGYNKFSGELQNNSKIELVYFENDRPQMVWIYLHNATKHNFTIYCVNDSLTTSSTITAPASEMNTASSKVDTTNSQSTIVGPNVTSEKMSSLVTSTALPSKSGMTSSDSNSVSEAEEHRDTKDPAGSLSMVLGAVAAVIVIITVFITTFILYRRRCKKPVEKDATTLALPNGQTNHRDKSLERSFEAIAKSNYDTINDESVATYSKPLKKMSDGVVTTDETEDTRDVSSDKYDRIELDMKCATKASNYDSLPALIGKVHSDAYSHVSSQSKCVSSATANEYSHCKFNEKESPTDSHSNQAADMDKPLGDDDYSHVDIGIQCKNERPSNKNKEDSYNHINFDETPNPTGNEKFERGGILPKTEKDCPAFSGVISTGAERERCAMHDVSTEVSCRYQQHQGIIDVSLKDNYMEFKQGDIYNTPRSKDEQYAVVVKNMKEHQPNEKDSGIRIKFGQEESNFTTQDITNTSDYELAKPVDF